jgi:CoA:oxalate CoA-transferase
MFKRLCEMIGHTELGADPRFQSDASRYTHRAALMPYVTAWASTLTTADILATAQTFRLPFEQVSTVDELAQDAHAQAHGMFPRLTQPGMGDIPVARQGMTLSAHARPQLQAAPAIGEHTERVLTDWLGYAPGQIAALREHGIFTAASRG